ncbi:unnamed protein product, partial [marine sediment metagenome]
KILLLYTPVLTFCFDYKTVPKQLLNNHTKIDDS